MKLLMPNNPPSINILTGILLLEVIVLTISFITRWPHLLDSWTGDSDLYNRNLNSGIIGCIALLTMILWWIIRPDHFRELRNNPAQFAAFLLITLFMPLTNLASLAIISKGFSVDPGLQAANMARYETLKDYQFYAFMIGVILILIFMYMKRRKHGPVGDLHSTT